MQNVEAKQTSDANGVLLDVPIDLEGQDGKEYEVKGDIEITYTNKLTAIPIVLKKVGFTNTDITPQDYDLPGASFTIYTTQEGREIAKDKDGIELKNLVSGEDGIFFNGMLNAGIYYLEETSVPDGYYAPLGRFKLDVGQDSTLLTATWVTSSTGETVGIVNENTDAVTGVKTYTVSLRNAAGVELPSTGGEGTEKLYIIGVLMLAFAAGIFMRNKAVQ